MERLTWDDIEALADANWHRRDAQGTMLDKVRAQFHAYTVELADAQATVEALQRERDALKTEVYDQKKLAEKYWKEAREADNKRVASAAALRDERDRLRAALEVAGDDICSEYCGAGPCHKKCLAVQAALTPAGGGQDGQG